eukprot:2353969-Pyramimonas_sp.AAC.1
MSVGSGEAVAARDLHDEEMPHNFAGHRRTAESLSQLSELMASHGTDDERAKKVRGAAAAVQAAASGAPTPSL